MEKTLLLCTFASEETMDDIINKIQDTYRLAFNSIYILKNLDQDGQYILTYNVVGSAIDISQAPAYTIAVHRKKHTNTIYTINAINKLIIEKIGHIDPNFKIDWTELQNMLLVTAYGDLKCIRTKIYDIVRF